MSFFCSFSSLVGCCWWWWTPLMWSSFHPPLLLLVYLCWLMWLVKCFLAWCCGGIAWCMILALLAGWLLLGGARGSGLCCHGCLAAQPAKYNELSCHQSVLVNEYNCLLLNGWLLDSCQSLPARNLLLVHHLSCSGLSKATPIHVFYSISTTSPEWFYFSYITTINYYYGHLIFHS